MPGAFELMGSGFEQVVYNHDQDSGLRAIIAIHSTALGPALGGTRFHFYANEDEALSDVLALSRAMTYKSALAGLDVGGGKAVIIGDPERDKTEPLLRAHGRFIDTLGGRYVTAEDVGTTTEDMELIARETRFVTGRSPASGGGGDPSGPTSVGVFRGIQAVAHHLWGSVDLAGRHVVVLGVGKVGSRLAHLLHEAGATLTVSDVNRAAAEAVAASTGAAIADPSAHDVPCDVLAPCALGGLVDDHTLPELRCAAIAGAANNVLASPKLGDQLRDAGVLYAPDFAINAGGIISVADELQGFSAERVRARTDAIFGTLLRIFELAAAEDAPTPAIAERLAEERLRAISRLPRLRVVGCSGSARPGAG